MFILEKEPVFPFLMLSAKQGNNWYHFYKVLRTQSQHSTTRLLRRWCQANKNESFKNRLQLDLSLLNCGLNSELLLSGLNSGT